MTIRQNMGLHSLVRVARQSAFGSAASDGFRPVRYFNWPLVETRPLVDSNALGAAPANFGDALPPVQGARAVPPGVMRVPLCWNEIGIWLGLLLGNPVSTDLGAGNYSHVFTGGAETIPVATADVRRTRISGTDTWDAWHDLAVLQAEFALTPGEEGHAEGAFTVQASRLHATGSSPIDSTPLDALTPDWIARHRGELRVDTDGDVASIVGAQLTYASGFAAERDARDADYITNYARSALASATMTFTARYRSNALLTIADAGLPRVFEFTWAKNANTALTLALRGTLTPIRGTAFEGPGGIEQQFSLRGHQTTGGSAAAMFVATLLNQQAGSVYA